MLVALGRQDIDPDGLEPPVGLAIPGSSSDHLVLDAGRTPPAVGSEVRFQLGYGALRAAMTSPLVARRFTTSEEPTATDERSRRQHGAAAPRPVASPG